MPPKINRVERNERNGQTPVQERERSKTDTSECGVPTGWLLINFFYFLFLLLNTQIQKTHLRHLSVGSQQVDLTIADELCICNEKIHIFVMTKMQMQ